MAQLIQSEERCWLIHTFQINKAKQFQGRQREVDSLILIGLETRQLLSKMHGFVYKTMAFRIGRLDFHPFVVQNFVQGTLLPWKH